jgi:O-antigen ligase
VVHFFTFFFPFALFDEQGVRNLSKVVDTVDKMILLSALLSLIMFFVAPSLEFVQEDFRGERYLNSNQTFFLVLAFCWLLVRILNKLNFRPVIGAAAFLFLAIAILSKNRTALASLAFVLLVYLLFLGKLRVILVSSLLVIAAGMAFAWFAPGTVEDVTVAFGGILKPTDDPDYSWRLLVQSAALEQGMDTFWSGEGYGSYFSYIVEDAQNLRIEEVTPHNQFLTLFLKTGVIGVFLIVVAMGWFLRESYRILRISREPSMVTAVITVMMLATASQFLYGFAYDFQAFFGIYLGFGTIIIREVHRELLETSITSVQGNKAATPIHKAERCSLEP